MAGFSSLSAVTESIRGLLARRTAIDYRAIAGDHRVLFLGEVHHSEPIRREVVSLVPLLRQMGFTHLAMELFHSASQTHLDYYAQGRIDRHDVIGQEMIWHGNTHEFDDSHWFPPKPAIYEPYFEIVDAVVAGGLTVLGIGWCRYDGEPLNANYGLGSRSTSLASRFASHGLTEEVLREIAKEDGSQGDLASEEYWDIFEHHLPTQNGHAAEILARALETGGTRIAVFGGQKHYGSFPGIRNQITVNRLLEASTGIRGAVAYFAVAEREKNGRRYKEGPKISKALFEAARDAGLGQEKFMVRTEPLPNVDMPDYIIHLPSV